MTKITFIEANGKHKTVEAENGLSLMVAAMENNITGIPAICNGCCSCGTCLVEFSREDLALTSTKYFGEEQVLEKLKNSNSKSRLACQVIVSDKLANSRVQVI
ncbi:2Fe-2S iron-sulfur cluster-binding protein [Thalassotalea sp. ND16A]|uniref:2Fe-2S iron-sulfur cluster-binding protein n=1 Tax=Thalassotalea sp. ND16A TaxID=1535422 RepID=UPI00051A8A6D|nr:2Fe-2S iron-sulfur cluster-binding protein [Thalassotalea sp. ND16A]KGJ98513.1 hypothetical protein ND16A_0583 [Thalassotalea sp. ND16A]